MSTIYLVGIFICMLSFNEDFDRHIFQNQTISKATRSAKCRSASLLTLGKSSQMASKIHPLGMDKKNSNTKMIYYSTGGMSFSYAPYLDHKMVMISDHQNQQSHVRFTVKRA